MGRPTWSEQDLMTLRRMLADGKTSAEIGEAVGRTDTTVRQFVRNNAEKLELDLPLIQGRCRYNPKQFDKDWYGSVPFGHWIITKPWRLTKLTKENANG